MHKSRKIFAVFFAIVMFWNSIGVAEASTKKPSGIWDWTNGAYTFSGAADYNDLYTNYRFTNMTKAAFSVTNTSGSYSLVVKVKSVEAWYKPDKVVSSATIPPGGTCNWEKSGLDSGKQYYIIFEYPCKFYGSITRK
ncbi:MAG: hypothetical protein J5738_03815 [Lachnospiraceae bacterium]|nr:hypothetical protein [Lachnospiraceae bacterium]MBO4669298.1 hypothetical protein [Lachnospiraceae bacterium]